MKAAAIAVMPENATDFLPFFGTDIGWCSLVKPQINFNDCKSLVDMAAKEGGMPTEKRTALDFHDVRQYLDQDDLEHISTNIMLADALTKHKSANERTALEDFLETGRFSVQSQV